MTRSVNSPRSGSRPCSRTATLAAGALTACSRRRRRPRPTTQTLTILSSFTTGNATGDQLQQDHRRTSPRRPASQVDVEEANTNDIAPTYEAS